MKDTPTLDTSLLDAKQATPHATLLAELLDSRIPKSEREHAAAREIERLTAAFNWQPIETAPKDNKRPLLLAHFGHKGELTCVDFDGSWERGSESWEMPQEYYFWGSANGNVDEPTHWAYQPEGFAKLGGSR